MKNRLLTVIILVMLSVLPSGVGLTESESGYTVSTNILTVEFESVPHIDIYSYIVGEYSCRLADYMLSDDASQARLISLTFADEITGALEAMDYDGRCSFLHMCMDMLEGMGYVVSSGEYDAIFDNAAQTFATFDGNSTYIGWAELNVEQFVILIASSDETGAAFLASAYTHNDMALTVNGRELAYSNIAISCPYSFDSGALYAQTQNAVTYNRVDLIQLPDIVQLSSYDEELILELLLEYTPVDAQDISSLNIGTTLIVEYSYETMLNDNLTPLQGRLIYCGDALVRMEATFDNGGDAFMSGLTVFTNS